LTAPVVTTHINVSGSPAIGNNFNNLTCDFNYPSSLDPVLITIVLIKDGIIVSRETSHQLVIGAIQVLDNNTIYICQCMLISTCVNSTLQDFSQKYNLIIPGNLVAFLSLFK